MKTGNQTISFEIKSQLAKLLATENISMRHNSNSKTACFDVEKRELILPVWQNISEDLYDMLVVHEVGHALDTPMDKWMDAIDSISKQHHELPTDKNKNAIKGFLNVIEDARIDKRQKRRYPGSRRNYVIGYKELYERDFFGISGRDVNTLTFIDRINIFFKNGAIFNIQFSDVERVFIRRIENAETFEDVVAITSDIYKHSIDTKDYKNRSEENQAEDAGELEYSSEDSSDMDSSDKNVDFDDTDDMDDTGAPNDDVDFDDTGDIDASNDVVDIDDTDATSASNEVDVPETEQAAENSIKSIVLDDNINYVYLHTPEFNYKNIVDDYTVVIPEMENDQKTNIQFGFDTTKIKSELISFKKSEQDSISFMVKEFEMRKAADTYSRVSVSKTGIIDTNKIYSYKYNDDIFKKMSVVSSGKNHGFVMFLDWSGSMVPDLNNTLKQLFSLVMFCKRVQIPFEVYTFRNYNFDEKNKYLHTYTNPSKENIDFDRFKLRNVLSSRMNIQTLNKAFELLWLVSYNFRMNCDPLDSTPLNQAILAADYVINKFKKETNIQIVNTIFLTDGGSDSIRINYQNCNYICSNKHVNKFFIRDTVTQKNYYINSVFCGDHIVTETFLKMLKERTGCNLIGFFVTSNYNNAATILNIDYDTRKVHMKKFRHDNYIGITAAGYDEYYIVNPNKISKTTGLNVNSDMTKKAVLKEFIKYSEKKTVNRILLSKFIQRIAA